MVGDLKLAHSQRERLRCQEQARRDRSRAVGRLSNVHARDAEIGPLVRRSRRWTTVAVVAWALLLPVVIVLMPVIDPLVGIVVPALEAVRVPLLVVGSWGGWFLVKRRWSTGP